MSLFTVVHAPSQVRHILLIGPARTLEMARNYADNFLYPFIPMPFLFPNFLYKFSNNICHGRENEIHVPGSYNFIHVVENKSTPRNYIKMIQFLGTKPLKTFLNYFGYIRS